MAIVSRAERGTFLAPAPPTTKTKCEPPPLGTRVAFAAHMYTLQTLLALPAWYRGWQEYFYPPAGGPDIVKKYGCRPALPVRIFFPAGYDQESRQPLPTVFTIHGGGFCIGVNRDDDEYNRYLANSQAVLVVSLSYTKSPAAVFPAALHDVEALYHAVVADESLPLARSGMASGAERDGGSRIALLGFSSGGNLAMALPQLPSIRASPDAPVAAISIYGSLDFSRDPADKLRNRFYKAALPLPQGSRIDSLAGLAYAFDWSYSPYGQDLTDPLLSPVYAPADALPRHTYFVAAELDLLAHESWRMACRIGKEARQRASMSTGSGAVGTARDVPDPESKVDRVRCVGRRASTKRKGLLEDLGGEDDRFGWEDVYADGSSVNWLLVPDAVHGFDNRSVQQLMQSEESRRDAEMKTRAYVERVGKWLHNVVWK